MLRTIPQIRASAVVNAQGRTVHVRADGTAATFVTVLQDMQDEVPGGWLPEQHVQYSEAGRMLAP